MWLPQQVVDFAVIDGVGDAAGIQAHTRSAGTQDSLRELSVNFRQRLIGSPVKELVCLLEENTWAAAGPFDKHGERVFVEGLSVSPSARLLLK